MDNEAILQIPLSLSIQNDCWAWHYERSGLFTVQSAYRMMIELKKSREDYFEYQTSCSGVEKKGKENGNNCGKWNCHPKSKSFVGLTLNSIPTGSVLKNRNIVDTAECKLFGADEDT